MKYLISLVFIILITGTTYSDSYSCNEVDDIAKLGYSGNLKVSLIAKNKKCKFSINGASADAKEMSASPEDLSEFDAFLQAKRLPGSQLQQILKNSSDSLGDIANSVKENLQGNTQELSNLSCKDEDLTGNAISVNVGNLEIKCHKFLRTHQSEPIKYNIKDKVEIILTRPSYIFEVQETRNKAIMIVVLRTEERR